MSKERGRLPETFVQEEDVEGRAFRERKHFANGRSSLVGKALPVRGSPPVRATFHLQGRPQGVL